MNHPLPLVWNHTPFTVVTSSVLMLKDNFVIYLMQGGELFGTIQELA